MAWSKLVIILGCSLISIGESIDVDCDSAGYLSNYAFPFALGECQYESSDSLNPTPFKYFCDDNNVGFFAWWELNSDDSSMYNYSYASSLSSNFSISDVIDDDGYCSGDVVAITEAYEYYCSEAIALCEGIEIELTSYRYVNTVACTGDIIINQTFVLTPNGYDCKTLGDDYSAKLTFDDDDDGGDTITLFNWDSNSCSGDAISKTVYESGCSLTINVSNNETIGNIYVTFVDDDDDTEDDDA